MTFRPNASVRVTLVALLALLALPLQSSHALRWGGLGDRDAVLGYLEPVCRDGTTAAVIRYRDSTSGLPTSVTVGARLGDFQGDLLAAQIMTVTTLRRPPLSVDLSADNDFPPSFPIPPPPYFYYARQKIAWQPLREPGDQVWLTPEDASGGSSGPATIANCFTVERNLTIVQRDALARLLPTGDKQVDRRIQKAVDALSRSLAPEFWQHDGLRLTDQGKKVFNEFTKAVRQLTNVEAHNPTVAAAIAALPDIACGLAGTAIEDAVAAGGNADTIARAEAAVAEGLAQLNAGDPAGAIGRFKQAWAHAQRAMGTVPQGSAFNEELIDGAAQEEP